MGTPGFKCAYFLHVFTLEPDIGMHDTVYALTGIDRCPVNERGNLSMGLLDLRKGGNR